MPELPEVETIRVGLSKLLPGKTVNSIVSDNQKSFPNAKTDIDSFLLGASVLRVERRAKVLMIHLSSNYSLVIHLKMTGQLVYVKEYKNTKKNNDENIKTNRFGAGHPNDSLIGQLPDRSTRVITTFTDGGILFFNDQRKFGWMKLIPTVEIPFIDFMKRLGPEPLEAGFTHALFIERISKRKNSSIKSAILDQSVLAGVGNIYADESLWAAKIHPGSLVKNVSRNKLINLHREIIQVLQLSIEKGGSTDRNYVNAEGKKGSYIEFAKVSRKEGKPCQRCSTEIIKIRVASRGTHICPKCQKFNK